MLLQITIHQKDEEYYYIVDDFQQIFWALYLKNYQIQFYNYKHYITHIYLKDGNMQMDI